jgi:hypothetical protein|tara:strand:+ start:191 stop:574 length:384 start_codon:yes stop_codon:yes gene_type:complete
LEHILYSDGNLKKISWVIQTNESIVSQTRVQTENYKDKITKIQSKYVALHVALFWGIGTFNIKNKDSIKIKLDKKIMYQQLKTQIPIQDEFIKNKIKFIQSFIKQRKLKVEFELINLQNNLAGKLLK